MTTLHIAFGPLRFAAQLEERAAPLTCAALRALLPLRGALLQAQWSGEAAWLPLTGHTFDLHYENHVRRPAPGDLLLYPGGVGAAELVFPYGATLLAGALGPLLGNHFATVVEGHEHLRALGRLVLWQGAQEITIRAE